MNRMIRLIRNAYTLATKSISCIRDNETHIQEAMQWLYRAQKASTDGGVSEAYHLYHGWLPSYPETTGYIIETFFAYYDQTGDEVYKDAAIRMAKWLLDIQNDDGSITNSNYEKKFVFDTGQVIFGLVKAYEYSGSNEYIDGAINAGNWLVEQQEDNGSWVKHSINNIPHAYYSRVAWSLAKLHELIGVEKYIEACKNNIEWCIKQQNENGWFRNASFTQRNHETPYTHTIAYTIRGILEVGIYLNSAKYIATAKRAIDGLMHEVSPAGYVPGTYNKDWQGDHSFTCLTGNAQLAICLFRLSRYEKENKLYRELAVNINQYLKGRQNITTSNNNIKGAIAGSHPIWGKYIHYAYPNWAVKFFVDALMQEDQSK